MLAAGAWTGQLLDAALSAPPTWAPLFRPRKGHLLELQPPASMPPLQHGLMEVSYTQVGSASAAASTLPQRATA